MPNESYVIFWFRRDLRIDDNHGLFKALDSGFKVLPIFIFDSNILKELSKDDKRVNFIHKTLKSIHDDLNKNKKGIKFYIGKPEKIFTKLSTDPNLKGVFTNEDYEPYAIKRDTKVSAILNKKNIPFQSFKDHVIFNPTEILKEDRSPYKIYTPYMSKWKSLLKDIHVENYNSIGLLKNLIDNSSSTLPSLKDLKFSWTDLSFPPQAIFTETIKSYHLFRNMPAAEGTSKLSLHIRFGTLSIRKLLKIGKILNETWLNELIWREFFQMIIFHYPETVHHCFRSEYDMIHWVNDETDFKAWCEGKTGYPMVDAGMRELNETGFMHNRVRMITASFLCKHLLIDWRWGERYFAEKLLDYELASNVGNWQWAAGCGCDAAPYFRIFNPITQQKKFDPEGKYIRKWIKELNSHEYPAPIIDHKTATERALKVYRDGLTDINRNFKF
ncbi:MAG: cryptochrome/photolyase family protein [Cytophagaceae bacterium]